jgi:hypothetical protein
MVGRHTVLQRYPDTPQSLTKCYMVCSLGAWGNEVRRTDAQAPVNGPPQIFPEALPSGRPPHRSEALPAGRPPQSLPVGHHGRNEVSNPGDVLRGQHRNGTVAGHACGKATPLHDEAGTIVPEYSPPAEHRSGLLATIEMGARRGGGCIEQDSADRTPAHDVHPR